MKRLFFVFFWGNIRKRLCRHGTFVCVCDRRIHFEVWNDRFAREQVTGNKEQDGVYEMSVLYDLLIR